MNKHAVILFSLFLCACGGSPMGPQQTAFSLGTEREISGFGEVSEQIIGLTQQVGGAPVFGEGGGPGQRDEFLYQQPCGCRKLRHVIRWRAVRA